MSTTTLTADEQHAAVFALATDLAGLAETLRNAARDVTNAPLAEYQSKAADLAGTCRMIGNLGTPLDVLLDRAGVK